MFLVPTSTKNLNGIVYDSQDDVIKQHTQRRNNTFMF